MSILKRKKEDNPTTPQAKKGGCLFPFLVFFIALIVVCVIAIFFVVKNKLSDIETYDLNKEEIVTQGNDENMKDYQVIALFGVDSQDSNMTASGTNSDTIILMSINKNTKEMKLLSVYRDTYVSIDGHYTKINNAYATGGPELAISTLNRNLDLQITDFVTVSFKIMADVVDALGGVTLTIDTEKELENLNDYITNMNTLNGGSSRHFTSTGTFTFDGNQAVAYSRIRYMEGGDHKRASHQRELIQAIMTKAMQKPQQLVAVLNSVLPQISTSLTSDEILQLGMDFPRYKIADSDGFPFDSEDIRYNGIYYGFPLTLKSNVVKAHEFLFGTKDYEVSQELSTISGKIEAATEEAYQNAPEE